jgi:glycosyltransferase involved in cell wall biosynthesis
VTLRISAITVCFNAAATIRRTLDSFFAQDWPHKEMVVVDGASSDATLDIVRRYACPELTVVSERDHGMYDALNKGLRLYRGDAFGVLNADDAYRDDHVLVRIADGLRDADMVHGHLDFVDRHGARTIVRRWRATRLPPAGFRTGWMPAHPTFYVRRQVQESVGDFDLRYHMAADYDWMLRAVEHGRFTLGLIDHVLVDMMAGGRSTGGLRSHLRHNVEALQSRRRRLGAGVVDYALFAKPARKLGQFVAPRIRSAQ